MRVVEPLAQIVAGDALTVTAGFGLTVTAILAVAEQLFEVPVTV